MRRTADEPVPARTVAVLERNVSRLVELTRQLEGVSRLREEDDNAQIQKADLTAVAGDVARQLREMADARGVTLHVDPELGSVNIDVARAELVLMNLMSNAIKYSNPAKAERIGRRRARRSLARTPLSSRSATMESASMMRIGSWSSSVSSRRPAARLRTPGLAGWDWSVDREGMRRRAGRVDCVDVGAGRRDRFYRAAAVGVLTRLHGSIPAAQMATGSIPAAHMRVASRFSEVGAPVVQWAPVMQFASALSARAPPRRWAASAGTRDTSWSRRTTEEVRPASGTSSRPHRRRPAPRTSAPGRRCSLG